MNDTHLFRKRPIPVTARQLNADSYREVLDALTPEQFAAGGENTNGTVFVELRTLEGVMRASEGDWIVWDNHRHVWPVRGSIFAETYEPITAQPPTDQAALRDRIAEALYAHDHPGWRVPLGESDVEPVYRERATAVLATLPEPTHRAAELLAYATVLEFPRPHPALPVQLRRSHGHTDRWAICDGVVGRRWHREHGWVYEPQGIRDEEQRDATRYTLAEAVPLAQKLAAGVRQAGERGTPVVAYRSGGGRLLRCLAHAPAQVALAINAFRPVTAEDLPDGGVCTYADCGVDVLIPQDGAQPS